MLEQHNASLQRHMFSLKPKDKPNPDYKYIIVVN